MLRFKRIVAFVNPDSDNQSLLNRAVRLAQQNKACLKLVDVFEDFEAMPVRWRKHGLKTRLDWLNDVRDSIGPSHLNIQSELLFDTTFLALINEVHKNRHDLLMKVVDSHEEQRRAFFGSTDLHLLRKCPCPVWLFQPKRGKRFARILAAVDPRSGDSQARKLNQKILELASSLAKLDESDLRVVSAWEARFLKLLKPHVSEADLDAHVDHEQTRSTDHLAQLLEPFGMSVTDSKVHLERGEASTVISDFASLNDTDLIVMGTVARSGIAGLFMGNTAEQILTNISCSVLAVKPEGFVSPVGHLLG